MRTNKLVTVGSPSLTLCNAALVVLVAERALTQWTYQLKILSRICIQNWCSFTTVSTSFQEYTVDVLRWMVMVIRLLIVAGTTMIVPRTVPILKSLVTIACSRVAGLGLVVKVKTWKLVKDVY